MFTKKIYEQTRFFQKNGFAKDIKTFSELYTAYPKGGSLL